MALGMLEHQGARRKDNFPASGGLGSQHGMSYNPSPPVSAIGVAQPLAQQSLGVDRTDHTRSARAYPTTTSDGQTAKKRRHSKEKVPPMIKRSSSTPHMRALALAESGQLSPNSDKRRNKLGYHRTSVACGHCRRRKIRCLLAPDDPQGRCSNCIRLKKECNFYPVEQQASGEPRPQVAKRGSVSAVPSSSSPSSPRTSTASGHDQIEEYGSYQSLATGEPPPGFGVAAEFDEPVDTKSHQSGVIPQAGPFSYSPTLDMGAWAPNYAPQAPSSGNSDGSAVAYWSASGPPTSSPFLNDSTSFPGQQSYGIQQGSGSSRERLHSEHMWSDMPRSMSFSGSEALPQDLRFQHANTIQIPPSQHQVPATPSSMDASSGPMNPTLQSAATFPFNGRQTWQPYVSGSTQVAPVQQFTGQWFLGSSSPGIVEEEQHHNVRNPYQRY